MDCKKVRSLYTLFREGELDSDTCKKIQEHLSDCSECLSLFASIDRIASLAGTYEDVQPESGIVDKVIDRFEETPYVRWFLKPRLVFAYTAVLLFLIGFSFGLIRRMNIRRQIYAKKKIEKLYERNNRYIIDYGNFENGQVIYSVPNKDNTVKVIEVSY
jgi:predicted anti-sigma-YlaC factor YlaD